MGITRQFKWLSILMLFPFLAEEPVVCAPQADSDTRSAKSTPLDWTAKISSQQGEKPFSKPYGSHLMPLLSRIGATDDQRRKITSIVECYRSRIEPLREEYKQKSQEFIQFIVHGHPAESIMSRQGELNNLYGIIVTQYGLMGLEIRRMLTPQQCRQYEEYRREQGWRR